MPSRYSLVCSSEGKRPAVGVSSRHTGQVSVSLPEGLTLPVTTSSAAPAPAWPPSAQYTTALASEVQPVSTEEPAESRTTTFGFTAATALMSCFWLSLMSMLRRSAPSLSAISSRPRQRSTTSARLARSTAASRLLAFSPPWRSKPGSKPTSARSVSLIMSRSVSTFVELTADEPAPW